jgi:aerobic-type carbon monoxide dehydrogenase small subunit (CoxS/CutS family)
MTLNICVNGKNKQVEINEKWTLLRVLRDELKLKGTKAGCLTGDCGTCTVLVDGEPKTSCTLLARKLEGKSVLTIEGMSKGEKLHPIQKAFVEAGAVQCGFCTPAMILRSKALLDKIKQPSRMQIREAINPNLCRCTGYQKIIDAVELASKYILNQEVQV